MTPHSRRRLLVGGSICLAGALTLAGVRPLVFGRPLPMVHVTWGAIDAIERRTLEQRFSLSEPTPVAGTTWAYVPLDLSPSNLGALVANPAAADTAGINRRTMTLGPRTPLTERRGGLWKRPPAGTARATLILAWLFGSIGAFALLAGVASRRGVTVQSTSHLVRAAPAFFLGLARRITIPVPLGIAVMFAGVAAFRLLALDFIDNDHFVSLTSARQVTLGALPGRDFQDPGLPLAIAFSAAALWLGGSSLLPEVVLSSSMLAFGAVVAWRASARVSTVPALALASTLLQVVAFPRLYSYPKILVNAGAALMFLAYARSPTRQRLLALAVLTEIAFLFRYDLGVYLGLATAVLLLFVHGARTALPRLSLYVAACAALTLPYALYLSAFGLSDHIGSALAFSRSEARRTLAWGAVLAEAQPLTIVVVLLPVVICVWLTVRRWRNGKWDNDAPSVAAIAVLLALLDAGMLRDRTHARLADVFGPAPVLMAWAGAGAIRATARASTLARKAAGVAVITGLASVIVADTVRLGAFPHQLGEAGLTEGWDHFSNHARRQVEALAGWPWTGITQGGVELEPLVRYLDACTARDARVLVIGFVPQLPFIARRPFAGGHPSILSGYFTSGVDERRMEAWLAERPAIVVIDPVEAEDIGQWPAIGRLLTRYRPPVTVGRFVVRTAHDLPATGVHAGTGLPCAGPP